MGGWNNRCPNFKEVDGFTPWEVTNLVFNIAFVVRAMPGRKRLFWTHARVINTRIQLVHKERNGVVLRNQYKRSVDFDEVVLQMCKYLLSGILVMAVLKLFTSLPTQP